MKVHGHIDEIKVIQMEVLEFLNNDSYILDDLQNKIESIYYSSLNQEFQYKLKLLFMLLLQISNDHHRSSNFFQKLEQIFSLFKDEIKKRFTNREFFDIFRSNKIIILYLLEEIIIVMDKYIINSMLVIENSKYKAGNYDRFFHREIKFFLEEHKIERELFDFNTDVFLKFDEKRHIGENDSYICQLIRDGSIEEFVVYVNRTNFPLSASVESSIFETNSFLIHTNPDLIEYAAFFGSIQIFQYLRLNNVELKPSLYLYAIHSNNTEMIHLLEENHIEPHYMLIQFRCYLK